MYIIMVFGVNCKKRVKNFQFVKIAQCFCNDDVMFELVHMTAI